MTDLATQTMLTTSGITRVIDRLERDGLVTRSACPTDRRGSTRPSPRRAGPAERRSPRHLDLIEKWFTGQLSRASCDLLASLRMFRDAVRPGATAGAASA